jgi:hypothetical protein
MIKKFIKSQLLVGAAGNISFGILIMIFPELANQLLLFDPMGNQLFRLFVAGVAMGLGIGYAYVYKYEPENMSLLIFGASLKYWASIITLYCFIYYDISIIMLIFFGIGNFLLAGSFSLHMIFQKRARS